VSDESVRAAAEALRRSVVTDPAAAAATVEQPIPVRGPGGELDSWFVALTTDEGIRGFLQLEPDLTLHRYSAFERPQPASAWLDTDAIVARAQAAAGEGDELGEPVLTYRQNRDRLTWRVPIQSRPSAILVAGDFVEREEAAPGRTGRS
jgi:hypothetical protein